MNLKNIKRPFSFIFTSLLMCSAPAIFAADYEVGNVGEFIALGLKNDPMLAESRIVREIKAREYQSIKHMALLPKFELTFAFGPAPSLLVSTQTRIIGNDTLVQPKSDWDFKHLGMYFGTEISVAQPLNVNRLNAGLVASKADAEVKEAELSKKEMDKAIDLQKAYYGYLYAKQMLKLARSTEKRLKQVEEDMVKKIENEDESVSQSDLLELQASQFEVTDGVLQSEEGLKKATLAMQFSLGVNPQDSIRFKDTTLVQRSENIPSLEELKKQLPKVNPDLKQLEKGIMARRALIDVAIGEVSPQVFLFGKFNFTKSWTPDRKNVATDNVFASDPLNDLSGALGLGVKFDMNVWSKFDKVEMAKLDLKVLKAKEKYALNGLGLKLEESYNAYLSQKERVMAAQKAWNASQSWVKASAIQYDMDPSAAPALLKAWIKNVGNEKVYFKTVYDYNLALADLFGKLGTVDTTP